MLLSGNRRKQFDKYLWKWALILIYLLLRKHEGRKVYLKKYSCIMYVQSWGGRSVMFTSSIFLCSWLRWKKPSLKRLKCCFFYIFKGQESLWTRRWLLMFHLCIFRLVLLFGVAIFVLSFLSFQYVYLPFKICEKYLKRKEKMLVF